MGAPPGGGTGVPPGEGKHIPLEGGVGVLGTCKSTCISENITLMKIGPFESYSKWSGELGTVG